MLDHHMSHDCDVKTIPGGIEYYCRDCGYYARYTVDESGNACLVVLFNGDPASSTTSARHTSGYDCYLEPFERALKGKL